MSATQIVIGYVGVGNLEQISQLAEQLVRMKLRTLLEDEQLVERYVEKHGYTIHLRNIDQMKKKVVTPQRTEEKPFLQGIGASPLYSTKIHCPVCQYEKITGYELKSKSQSITYDRFRAPYYKGVAGFQTVNYTRVGMIVCPRCYFASPDKKDFITFSPSSGDKIASKLDGTLLRDLKEQLALRQSLVEALNPPGTPEEFFEVPRTTEAVLTSFDLGVLRTKVEIGYKLPNSCFKAGAYLLKKASVQKEEGIENRETYKEALQYLEQSFSMSNASQTEVEAQVVYQIVALHLRLGDEKKAHQYIQALGQITAELLDNKESKPSDISSAERWLNECKRLWEDREIQGIWD